jgi:hypothetical protein
MNAFTSNDDTKIPVPNKADILAHLMALFPPKFVHPYPDAMLELAYGPPGSPNRARLFSAFDVAEAASFAETQNLRGFNVYVGPTLKKGGTAPFARTDDNDVLAGLWTWTDHDKEGDFERAQSRALERGLSPVIVVQTGTVPHVRAHCYFRIEGGIADIEVMRTVNRAVQQCLGGDPVHAPGHIMRLAGTVNYPTPKKREEKGHVIETVTLRVDKALPEYSPKFLLTLESAWCCQKKHRERCHELNWRLVLARGPFSAQYK